MSIQKTESKIDPHSKTNRRNLLKGAALTGLAAGTGLVSGCTAPQSSSSGGEAPVSNEISARTVAEAEKLQGISYTPNERQMMLEGLEQGLESLARLQAMDMPNELAPALVFDPRVPGRSYGSQRNLLIQKTAQTLPLPSDETDIAFASVADQGRWLRAGMISSERLTQIYLSRIEKYADTLECFVTVTPQIARDQAAKADQLFKEGKDRGPLQGIPYGLKDLADVEGGRTTWGAATHKDRIASSDADVVRRLKRAGAVMLGKTTCGALAYGDQWFGGKTRNPWNLEEGSSGSSAGSASATAAGLCAFSIGTETLGSIISPSERCGTTGLRPTFGRVSRAGFMALCWSLDKVGPICRNVEDHALVLSEINGVGRNDPSTTRFGFTFDGSTKVEGMKVGYVPEWFEAGDDADRAALEAMRGLGVKMVPFKFPEIDFETLVQIVLVESAAAFSQLTLSDRDDELTWQDREAWPNSWRQARFISAVDYVQMDRLRRELMVKMGEAFEGYDALIGPHYSADTLLATNCTGHPQLAIRAGFAQLPSRDVFGNDADGQVGPTAKVPRGISLWGDLYQEGKLINLGVALEQALNVANARPPGF